MWWQTERKPLRHEPPARPVVPDGEFRKAIVKHVTAHANTEFNANRNMYVARMYVGGLNFAAADPHNLENAIIRLSKQIYLSTYANGIIFRLLYS